ncbi:MAG: hypothetical protein ACREQ9_02180 [Candidatus Binatia bacterium]
MSDLQKLAIKLFVEPGAVRPLADFIPVFHRWIQMHAVNGVLVDVADYSHVESGPGVLLIGHEANYAIDVGGGRMGLLYSRKQPSEGGLAERLARHARSALTACRLLEQAPELERQVRFRTGEVLIVANDRLLAPNTEETLAELRPALDDFLARLYGDARVTLERELDPKERFAVTALADRSHDVDTLLARLSS